MATVAEINSMEVKTVRNAN